MYLLDINNGFILQFGYVEIPNSYTAGNAGLFSYVHSITLNLLVSFELIGRGFCITSFGDFPYTGNCSANCVLSTITLSVGGDNDRTVPCCWFAIGF